MGYGSSVPCVPFTDCPNGTGYVPVAERQLRSQGFVVTLRNLGIPTAVIGRDFETLGQQYNRTIVGNFIEQEMPFVLPNSTVITVFAGGNEVNTITAALGAGAGGSDPNGYIDAQVRNFGADYTTLINGLRTNASAAHLIVLNLPNLGAMPYLSRSSAQQRQAAQRVSVGMTTTVINRLTTQNVTVIDLMCDGRAYQAGNLSSDGFHPSDSGYAFIAGELVKAMTSTYPSPATSCAQMSLVQ
jgi:lysophospholipase L1-like esterase